MDVRRDKRERAAFVTATSREPEDVKEKPELSEALGHYYADLAALEKDGENGEESYE